MAKRSREAKPDERRFVQVAERPSLGVEVTTGQAWVGVDQQVGHGSADALFALTDDEYAGALVDAWTLRALMGECWGGGHPERLLFHPGGGSWRPAGWLPRRIRMLRQGFDGELWWHVDAVGEPADGERVATSQALSAGTAQMHVARLEDGVDGVRQIVVRLVGEGAYPRPAALIGGLDAGSDRERARAILGDPIEASADVHMVEGIRVRLGYGDGGLVEVSLERPDTPRPPGGPIGVLLAALGEAEEGAAFQAAARLAGVANRRWAVSSGHPRRLLAFDGGVDIQVEDDRVLSVRIDLAGFGHAGDASRDDAVDLVPGAPLPASRADLHRILGAPVATSGATDLHRYGRRDLLVDSDATGAAASAIAMTAVLGGVSTSPGMHRWRSGDFTRFLDVLGRPSTNPLVAHVRALPGVRVRERRGVVTAVEVEPSAARPGCFADDMPSVPTRTDMPFGLPTHIGERDDAWDLDRGFVHVHASDGSTIARITVCDELPPGVAVDGSVPPEDRGPWRPASA